MVLGCSDANIRFLYDPDLSQQGIMRCLVKQEKRKAIDSVTIFQRTIMHPALYEDQKEKEMEKDPFNPNNQNITPTAYIPPETLDPNYHKQKVRNDPLLTKKPEKPIQGPQGVGGKISSSGTINQYIMKNIVVNK
mmetsp:Transcript_26912/g.25977  ORF Transcript_26912/g.25977 Transcript_26912/m.25977 type:complete len:135 (-) Transcript_26912:159-563(-)